MLFRVIFFLLALVLSNQMIGQNQDSLRVAQLFKSYTELRNSKNYDRALDTLRVIEKESMRAGLLAFWIQSQTQMARIICLKDKEPYKALEVLDSCSAKAKAWPQPMSFYDYRSLCGLFLEEFFICKEYIEDFVRGKTALMNAYDIFISNLNGREDAIAGFLFFQHGNNFVRLEDFDSAKRLFEEGLEYSHTYNAPKVAKYSDVAGFYMGIDSLDKAEQLLREGLARQGMSEEDLVFVKLTLVECLVKEGRHNEASVANKEIESQIGVSSDSGVKRKLPQFQYGICENYALIANGKGNCEGAIDWYDKAIAVAHGYDATPKRQLAFFYKEKGNVLLNCGRYEEAIASFQSAYEIIQSVASKSSDDGRKFKAENILYKVQLGKAQAFMALDKPEEALQCYELVPLVETKLLESHLYESSSLRSLENSRPRTNVAMDLAWGLYEHTHAPNYAQRAFLLSELTRNNLLLKTMRVARTSYQLPDSIRQLEYELRIKTEWHKRQIDELTAQKEISEEEAAKLQRLNDAWGQLKNQQEVFRSRLAKEIPGYENLLREVKPLEATQAAALLRPDQALLNYFLTDSTAYIFLVDAKGALQWEKSALPLGFRDSIMQGFIARLANYFKYKNNRKVADEHNRWLKNTAADLYQLLVAPMEPHIGPHVKSLVVAPDDVLAFLPFEILLRKKSTADWDDLPYLIKDYSISYAYSATVLERQQHNTREHGQIKRTPCVGFAPTYKTGTRDPQTDSLLNTISGMEELVKTAKARFGGEAFIGDEANETQFFNIAPLCRILLFAMHGFANEEYPELSRLIFGNPQKDSSDYNVLYTNKLQRTYLPADLAVLNACYSGYGKLHKGEGVYSITRALTSAGVPATLMSIWELHGASSPALVDTFFLHIKDGLTKDIALQQAKLAFLANPTNESRQHPAFWASLLATGDMSALQF